MTENSSQILSEKSYMIMAGAGAGKTTRLVKHIVENFISFKKKHGRWPRIVGTTFTKKAASEIQDRVSVQYKTYSDPEIFEYAYSSSLNIGTVHSLCLKLLRSKAHLLGFTQDLKVVSSDFFEFEKRRSIYQIVNADYQNLLSDYGFNSLLAILNFMDRQKEFALQPITEALQQKFLKSLISETQSEFNSLFEKIPESDLEGIKNADLAYSYLLNLGEVLKQAVQANDFLPVLNFFESQEFRKPSFKIKNLQTQSDWQNLWEFRNNLKNDLKDNYAKLFDPKSFKKLDENSKAIYEIQSKYLKKLTDYKKQSAHIEMSDIEPLTLELLKNHLENCQDFIKQWDFYYIDEYQDTNQVQKEIFDILLQDVNYFKVGDPQQSIYLFRGAKSSIYEQEFQAAKSSPSVELDFLETNYRSKSKLLLGVNELFEQIDAKSFRPMIPFENASDEDNQPEDSALIKIHLNLTESQEKAKVIECIKEKIQKGAALNEICILARTKSLLYTFEAELQKHQIPSVLLVSGNFENRMEVRQCLILLSFLEDPHDDQKILAVLRSKNFKISDDELVEIFRVHKASKTWSLWTMLQTEDYQNKAYVSELKSYESIYRTKGRVEVLKYFLLNSNILYLAKNSNDLNRRHSNLNKLLFEIVGESIEQLNQSESFKSILSKKTKSQNSEAIFSSSNSGVKLMTIHGSKGLEFENVLVVGCHVKGNLTYTEAVEVDAQGVFVAPYTDITINSKISGPLLSMTKKLRVASERQETLRQIYVAATRAKHELHFFGQSRLGDNSIFRNMKLTDSDSFKYIEVIDSGQNKTEKSDFAPREWDFETYRNTMKVFKRPNLTTHKSIESSDRVNAGLANISVTKMVELILSQNEKFHFKKLNEVSFHRFEIKNMHLFYQKTLAGELFHRYLELFAKGLSINELSRQFQNTYIGDLSELQQVIQSLLKITTPNFAEVFGSARVEWGFNSYFKGNYLVSGQIDLWGMDARGVIHVVDYKSGSSRFQKKAAVQVHLYKEVLSKIYPKHDIKTHVLYIAEGKLVSLETQLDYL